MKKQDHRVKEVKQSKGSKTVCAKCGAFLEGTTICITCRPQSHILKAESGSYRITASPIGFVVESPQDHPDGRTVTYKPASGGQSVSKMDATGCFHADLLGSLERGRPGEPHVMKILVQVLRANGHEGSQVDGAQDARGQDALLSIDGHLVAVQIVTLPVDPLLWRALATRGAFSHSGDRLEAVRLVREVLNHKAVKARGTLLALDASHVGALACSELVDAYIGMHGNPADEFSLVAVWIIGPTQRSSICLGRAAQRSREELS
jgi:hypothetical protein